ncbi:unnamed protein product [Rotaria magnacalcarata]|uniref:N-terminal methionine N(alpha)-acetyltransferase NatE n=1 Tax=Rotaria magnacalcarata TaxID=392030 RepID=A0A816VYU2_9BILA|nr:unnamed protein product [Rotaria magnacalcarata]CAF3937244.1 unnamed protein product [Rotaria magnacalcarata]
MYKLFVGRKKKGSKHDSTIQIYHNIEFPLNDIIDIFYPIFGQYYRYEDLVNMIYSVPHIFCAYDIRQGQCVGCALVDNVSNSGGVYLMLFGVHESYQGHGVGTQLLKNIIRWAYRIGHTFIHLHVHVLNHKAMGLYEKVGFKKYEYLPNYYGNLPKRPPHAFRMVLPL